jgi:hypothetical protein
MHLDDPAALPLDRKMKAMCSLTSRIAPVPKSLLLAGAAAIFLLVTCTFGYLILDSRSQLRGESLTRGREPKLGAVSWTT